VVSRNSYSRAVDIGEVELNLGPQVGLMKIDRILAYVKNTTVLLEKHRN
jgi:hypothetical protein